MKDLPKVFSKPIEKELRNNTDLFYSKLLDNKKDTKNILKEIDSIFQSRDFVYKSKVEITTKDHDILHVVIVGKSGNSLLTMDGKRIRITDILDIKKL